MSDLSVAAAEALRAGRKVPSDEWLRRRPRVRVSTPFTARNLGEVVTEAISRAAAAGDRTLDAAVDEAVWGLGQSRADLTGRDMKLMVLRELAGRVSADALFGWLP